MLPSLDQVGGRIEVSTRDHGEVVGWIRGAVPGGLLIALDREGRDIRLVRNITSSRYDPKDRAEFAVANAEEVDKKLNDLNRALKSRLDQSFAALDTRPLQRFSERAPVLMDEIHRSLTEREDRRYRFAEETPADNLVDYLSARGDEVTELHADIFYELERSKIADTVGEFGNELSRLPLNHALPYFDSELVGGWRIMEEKESIKREVWTPAQHLKTLNSAQRVRAQLLSNAVFRSTQPRDRSKRREEKSERQERRDFSKWTGASLRAIAGTSLIAADATFGVTAGLMSTITSIGLTAVPVYVGVATSIYTGLVQAADALEKFGDLL